MVKLKMNIRPKSIGVFSHSRPIQIVPRAHRKMTPVGIEMSSVSTRNGACR